MEWALWRAEPGAEDVVQVERWAQVVALTRVHPQRRQLAPLVLRFDPLGDNLEAQCPAQLYERLNDRSGLAGIGQSRNEGLVDLQHVDRKLLQVGEGGEPG